MSHIHKGRIFVSTAPAFDAYDCTLRFHHAQEKAHLILAHDPQQASRLLQALAAKQRFAYEAEEKREEGVEKWGGPGELVKYSRSEQLEQGLSAAREFSKQIEMAVETESIMRSNNDRENKLLVKQQEELASFLEVSQIKDHLQQFRDAHGHPKVLSLADNLPTLLKLHNGGIDQLCLLTETGFASSRELFAFLEYPLFYIETRNFPTKYCPLPTSSSTCWLLQVSQLTASPSNTSPLICQPPSRSADP